MTITKAPGKLFLAGEYAVTTPATPAIIAAIDRYITVDLSTADTEAIHLETEAFGELTISLADLPEYVATPDWEVAVRALQIFAELLSENGWSMPGLNIHINSDLTQDDHKLGLGASGAVTVALLDALSQHTNLPMNKLQLFKLATLSLFSLPDFAKGSFGDVAAATFGGLIAYEKFSTNQLEDWLQADRFFGDMIALPWEDLRIRPLTWPTDWHLAFGWTGRPASTQTALAYAVDPEVRQNFVTATKTIVDYAIKGITENNYLMLVAALQDNQALLASYTDHAGIPFMTPELTTLILDAQADHLVAKVSGAGGGDNGFALANSVGAIERLQEAWRTHGITPLKLAIAPAKD
jgi:phosphomevalonate kinase